MNKKVFLPILITVMLLAATIAAAAEFNDVSVIHSSYSAIDKLAQAGIIGGYPDGSFRPEGGITRAEFVKMTNLVFKVPAAKDAGFPDVRPEQWFYKDISAARAAGYIHGHDDGMFRPDDYVTREQVCKMIDILAGLMELPDGREVTDEVSKWAEEYVRRMLANRLMPLGSGGLFRAREIATRAEVCEVLAKFLVETPPSGGGETGQPVLSEREQINKAIDDVLARLEAYVLPALSTEAQKEIVRDIQASMRAYRADPEYDYKEDAEETYQKYLLLTEAERKELSLTVQMYNDTSQLLMLKDFFFD